MKPKMKKRFFLKQRFFIAPIVAIILFLNSFGDVSNQSKEFSDAIESDKLVLFIIHMDSLMCFPCLNPFLDFYKLIPSPFRENRLWGVVVYENPKKKEEKVRREKIVKKKLRGFLKANNIECPIVLDSFHSFKEFSKGGTTLLVFDQRKKIVEKYVFPLKKKQIEEILNSLRN